MLILTTADTSFVFVPSPLVALPPVVLPLTEALPDDAVWELLFTNDTLFVLATVVLLTFVVSTSLVEFGPVLLTEAVVWVS